MVFHLKLIATRSQATIKPSVKTKVQVFKGNTGWQVSIKSNLRSWVRGVQVASTKIKPGSSNITSNGRCFFPVQNHRRTSTKLHEKPLRHHISAFGFLTGIVVEVPYIEAS